LVSVESGRGYHIPHLSHSHAKLLPEARDFLTELGHAFADELKGTPSEGTRLRITSLTRTAQQQKQLTRQNYNAIDRESTHSYGASFDIAFMDRPHEGADCSLPTRAAQKVLERFQSNGRILVIPEGQCLHVTVRRYGEGGTWGWRGAPGGAGSRHDEPQGSARAELDQVEPRRQSR
jgi:hypothetical protein